LCISTRDAAHLLQQSCKTANRVLEIPPGALYEIVYMISEAFAMFPMERLDRIVRKETRNVKSIVHDYGHLKRTAVGARWFVRILGGTKEEEELAYAAGLLHDIVRPASEKLCHVDDVDERSRKILSGIGISEGDAERIVEAALGHRKVHEWKSVLHRSVFVSDKLLEQMGAYTSFRKSYYPGECMDYVGFEPMEALLDYILRRRDMFNVESFEPFFRPLAEYQYGKALGFYSALESGKAWARELALHMYGHGKRHDAGLEEAVRLFKPSGREGEQMKKEALLYMEGKMFPRFEEILLSRHDRNL